MDTSITQVDDGYELTLSKPLEDMPQYYPREHRFTFSLTRIELELLHTKISTVLLIDLEIHPSR